MKVKRPFIMSAVTIRNDDGGGGGSWQLFEMSYAAVQTQQNKVRKNSFLLRPVTFHEDLFEGRKLEVKRRWIRLYYIQIC